MSLKTGPVLTCHVCDGNANIKKARFNKQNNSVHATH